MGIGERLGRLFGKAPAANATVIADRARARGMHGQALGQTDTAQADMRRNMEAELDVQRANRSGQATPRP